MDEVIYLQLISSKSGVTLLWSVARMEVFRLVSQSWTLRIEFHELGHRTLFFLHGVVKPLNEGAFLLLKFFGEVHDFLGHYLLFLDLHVVHLRIGVKVFLHLHVLELLGLLLDFFHFEVHLLFCHDCVLS